MIVESIEPVAEPVKQDRTYEVEREKIGLKGGQKLRNVMLSETRLGKNDDGEYIMVFLDTTDGENFMFYVSADMTPNKNVWGRQFIEKFLYTDDETGYFMVKPEFIGKPVFFGKQEIKGKRYHNLVWGFEEVEPVAHVANPAGVDEILVKAHEDGLDVFGAGQKLVQELGLKPAEALDFAKKFFGE